VLATTGAGNVQLLAATGAGSNGCKQQHVLATTGSGSNCCCMQPYVQARSGAGGDPRWQHWDRNLRPRNESNLNDLRIFHALAHVPNLRQDHAIDMLQDCGDLLRNCRPYL